MKQVFILLLIAVSFSVNAQKVLGPVSCNDPADAYATHLDDLGKGGLRVVADIAERNAITDQRRKEFMVVIVKSDSTWYQLQGGILNANWVAIFKPGITITIGGNQNLQSVTDAGHTTTNDIQANIVQSVSDMEIGRDALVYGDVVAGKVQVRGANPAHYGRLNGSLLTGQREYELPNKDGVVALLDDIPAAIPPAFYTNSLASTFSPANETWVDINSISIPASGTYNVSSSTTVHQNSATATGAISFRLINATNSQVIASGTINLVGFEYKVVSLSNIYSAAGAFTAKLQVYTHDVYALSVKASNYGGDDKASVMSVFKLTN